MGRDAKGTPPPLLIHRKLSDPSGEKHLSVDLGFVSVREGVSSFSALSVFVIIRGYEFRPPWIRWRFFAYLLQPKTSRLCYIFSTICGAPRRVWKTTSLSLIANTGISFQAPPSKHRHTCVMPFSNGCAHFPRSDQERARAECVL